MLRTSPFGVIVGAALLAVAGLPLVVPDEAGSTDPAIEDARRQADRLGAELDEQTERAAGLAAQLAEANSRLAAARIPATTTTTAAGSAAQLPQDGLDASPSSNPPATSPGTSEPTATTSTTAQAPTTPTTVPAPATTVPPGQPCPSGYQLIQVTTPLTAARVCLRIR